MKANIPATVNTAHILVTKEDLINNDRFVKGIVYPLGIGLSLYAITATSMIMYDVFSKLFV